MDIQALAVEVISNGAAQYQSFGALSELYDEYNLLDVQVDDHHLAVKQLQDQYNNYQEFLVVERGQENPSDLTIQVLQEQAEVVAATIGLVYKDISENLIKMALLENVIEYIVTYTASNEDSEDSETEVQGLSAKAVVEDEDLEDDEEDYNFDTEYGSDLDDEYGVDSDEDYEPEEDDDAVEYENEDGVLLFSLEFNPSMPEHLKIMLSEYIQDCTKIFVDEIINIQKEKDEAAKMETETPEAESTESYDNPYAVVFGSDFGKITGELSVSSPEPAATEEDLYAVDAEDESAYFQAYEDSLGERLEDAPSE